MKCPKETQCTNLPDTGAVCRCSKRGFVMKKGGCKKVRGIMMQVGFSYWVLLLGPFLFRHTLFKGIVSYEVFEIEDYDLWEWRIWFVRMKNITLYIGQHEGLIFWIFNMCQNNSEINCIYKRVVIQVIQKYTRLSKRFDTIFISKLF